MWGMLVEQIWGQSVDIKMKFSTQHYGWNKFRTKNLNVLVHVIQLSILWISGLSWLEQIENIELESIGLS